MVKTLTEGEWYLADLEGRTVLALATNGTYVQL